MYTLEDILIALGSKRPFLKDIKNYDGGGVNPFTEKGGEVYGNLIEILYAVGKLTDTEKQMASIVKRLDSIADLYF